MSYRARASLLALSLLGVLALAGCGGSSGGTTNAGASPGGASASAASCTGTTVKVMTIATLSGAVGLHKEIPEATQSAAKAINASCELGVPMEVIACDDKFDPNTASACARQAVSEKVLAVIGDTGQFGQQTIPILRAAKIPTVGFYQNGKEASSSPTSFPFEFGLTLVRGEIDTAASLGATKIAMVYINTPAVQFLVDLAKTQIASLGGKLVASIGVAPTATDLSTAAGQVTSSGAEAVLPILLEGGTLQLLKAMRDQGTDLNKVHYITSGLTATPAVLAKWGAATTEGIYITQGAWPIQDSSNAGIAKMRAELSAAGNDPSAQSDYGVIAWTAMHSVAKLMKGEATIDGASLMAKLNSSPVVTEPTIPSIDFSKPAYPSDPVLSKLRIFANQVIASRIVKGTPQVITDGFQSTENKFTVKRVGG
jgi:ABC-type branched-subunit amino acid transport system substrate-binding protein